MCDVKFMQDLEAEKGKQAKELTEAHFQIEGLNKKIQGFSKN